jgi:hypothetical protein
VFPGHVTRNVVSILCVESIFAPSREGSVLAWCSQTLCIHQSEAASIWRQPWQATCLRKWRVCNCAEILPEMSAPYGMASYRRKRYAVRRCGV